MLRGPLSYEIGLDGPFTGAADRVTEVSYDAPPAKLGQSIAYCNLFNEKYADQSTEERARYAPYLSDSDTAKEYGEGEINPRGPGWSRNIDEQINKRLGQGHKILEWDNPDAYTTHIMVGVLERAWARGLCAVAKNPIIVNGEPASYVGHPSIAGCIVEFGCGTVDGMAMLRRQAGHPILPVWFVCFGISQKRWGDQHAALIKAHGLVNMGVTWSPDGEYTDVVDLLKPIEVG